MITRKLQSTQFIDRARRSAREIGLAVALTLAGVTFLVAALHGGRPETASISAPQAGVENHSN